MFIYIYISCYNVLLPWCITLVLCGGFGNHVIGGRLRCQVQLPGSQSIRGHGRGILHFDCLGPQNDDCLEGYDCSDDHEHLLNRLGLGLLAYSKP